MAGVILFNAIFIFIIALVIVLRVLLYKSMKDSLYHYRNIFFIAGMLFLITLNIALYIYLLSCLLETKIPTLRYMFLEFVEFPKNFAFVALPLFAILCLLISISNLFLIKYEGFRLKNLLGVLLGIFFVGGTVAILVADYIANNKILTIINSDRVSIATVIITYSSLFFLLSMCYVECFFIGTMIMSYAAAKQKPVHDKDFIIILGCKINKKGGLLPLLRGRTNRAVRYAWEQEIASGKRIRFIPSGGKGTDEIMSEGSAMELYLLSHGVEQEEIIPEKESKNTYENFLFSKKIIDNIDPSSNVCFTTTNYHMLRSGILARKAGLKVEGVSSKTKWYFWPNGFVREFIALIVMYLKQHIIVIGTLGMVCIILGFLSYIFSISR